MICCVTQANDFNTAVDALPAPAANQGPVSIANLDAAVAALQPLSGKAATCDSITAALGVLKVDQQSNLVRNTAGNITA